MKVKCQGRFFGFFLSLILSHFNICVKSSVCCGDSNKISTFTHNGPWLGTRHDAQLRLYSPEKNVSTRYRDPIDRIYLNTQDCHSHAIKSLWHWRGAIEIKQRTLLIYFMTITHHRLFSYIERRWTVWNSSGKWWSTIMMIILKIRLCFIEIYAWWFNDELVLSHRVIIWWHQICVW